MTGHPKVPPVRASGCAAGRAAVAAGDSALAQNNRAAEIATYQGPDREKRLIEGAKKEGELLFYASIPVADIAVADRGLHQEIRRQGQGLARRIPKP